MDDENLVRVSTRLISERFSIPQSTLRYWRRLRMADKRYPRYHKLFTGQVYYVLQEFEEDFLRMHTVDEI